MSGMLFFNEWEMPREVKRRVVIGDCIREYSPTELLNTIKIKVPKWNILMLGRRSISVNDSLILISEKKFDGLTNKQRASVIYHELVHIAQLKSLGWLKFKVRYVYQWICADFSYKKMKQMGLEKEAIDKQGLFARRVNSSENILL